jgi:hypothetical protein
MEKIFGSYSIDRGLIHRIYKELKKLNMRRTNNPINNWENELNRTFSEELQMVKKHMKKCSVSIAIKEMCIKTTLRFCITPVKMAIIKKTNNHNASKGVGRKEPSYTVGRYIN